MIELLRRMLFQASRPSDHDPAGQVSATSELSDTQPSHDATLRRADRLLRITDEFRRADEAALRPRRRTAANR